MNSIILTLPDRGILLEGYSREITILFCIRIRYIYWTMYFNLPHVGIPPILVVAGYCNLYHKHSNRLVLDVFYWNVYPAYENIKLTHAANCKFFKQLQICYSKIADIQCCLITDLVHVTI